MPQSHCPSNYSGICVFVYRRRCATSDSGRYALVWAALMALTLRLIGLSVAYYHGTKLLSYHYDHAHKWHRCWIITLLSNVARTEQNRNASFFQLQGRVLIRHKFNFLTQRTILGERNITWCTGAVEWYHKRTILQRNPNQSTVDPIHRLLHRVIIWANTAERNHS